LVLLDLHPLLSASAFQGIGRYLRELLAALVRLQGAGELPVTIGGLDTHSQPWRVVAGEELRLWLTKSPQGANPQSRAVRLSWAGKTLQRAGCACFHQAEPHQVPFTAPVPLVLTYHDLIPLELPHLYSRKAPRLRQALFWAITRWRLFLASQVVTVSSYVATTLRKRFAYPAHRLTVAYEGVDHSRFRPEPKAGETERLQQKWGLQPGYWLFVGTGDPRKNLGFMLKAVARSGSRRLVVLAGRIDPRQQPLVDKALAESGLAQQVRFLGFVDEEDLPALYRQSLGLLFPSLSEGFGLPLLEAMACGKPALAFACSSLPEVAGNGAWLLPPGDLSAFAAAIAGLESSPEKQRELGSKGYLQAQRFTWEATARKVVQAYGKALGRAW
jgi:glycosyltransferase involved in cell wall biosynthesis